MKLCVAACQILTYPDPRKSADRVIHWMKKARQDKVDVVSFPEARLCGYQCAPRLGIAVVLGTAHWEAGKLYNSLLVIDKNGQVLGRYSKMFLAERWPTPGQLIPLWNVA